MPMFVKKGGRFVEIPREVRAAGEKAIAEFVKDEGKAYHAKRAAGTSSKAPKKEEGADQ